MNSVAVAVFAFVAMPAGGMLAACGAVANEQGIATASDAAIAAIDSGVAREGGTAAQDAGDAGGALEAGPAVVCDVRAYGAKGDGKTKDTTAIQAAIDACATAGGTVWLQGGTFLSGMIRLKSNIVLHLDATATLLGTQDDADYPTQSPPTQNTQLKNCRKSLVYAESAENIRIEGRGTINGNGNTPKWIGPSTVHPEATRPMALFTALCKHVTVEDVTIKDAAMWGPRQHGGRRPHHP